MNEERLYLLVEERCSFFHLRIKTYAEIMNLNEEAALKKLMEIGDQRGQASITSELDAVLPAYLHSSRMPGNN